MLQKRTNILFDQKTWDYLVGLSQKEKVSVSDLIRRAVQKQYVDDRDQIIKRRREAFDAINKIRATIKHTFTREEIREMIEDGRKY